MPNDAVSAIIVAVIGAVGLVLVALINRGGKKAAGSGGAPQHPEAGEHAHTRDVVKAVGRSLHLRLDALERVRGEERQQEQVGRSADAIGRRIDGQD